MNCNILETDKKELECRRMILNSIECALRRGDEVLDKFTLREIDSYGCVSFKKFKESLKQIKHENLKK